MLGKVIPLHLIKYRYMTKQDVVGYGSMHLFSRHSMEANVQL